MRRLSGSRIPVKALTRFIEEDNNYYKEIFMKYSTNPVQIAAIKLWEELLEDLIEFLEYEADRKTRTWTDIRHFKILQIKVLDQVHTKKGNR